MASKLAQLKSKACQAKQFVATHGTSYYNQLLEQNKQYIQKPATVEKCNELSKKLLYTRLARFFFVHSFARLRGLCYTFTFLYICRLFLILSIYRIRMLVFEILYICLDINSCIISYFFWHDPSIFLRIELCLLIDYTSSSRCVFLIFCCSVLPW